MNVRDSRKREQINSAFSSEESPSGVGSFNLSGPSSGSKIVAPASTENLICFGLESPDNQSRKHFFAINERRDGSITPLTDLLGTDSVESRSTSRLARILSKTSEGSYFSSSSSESLIDEEELVSKFNEKFKLSADAYAEDVDTDDSDFEECELQKKRLDEILNRNRKYKYDGSIFIHEESEEKEEKKAVHIPRDLTDYKTVADICSLSLQARSKLSVALNSQLLDSMSFNSSLKLSEIPPVLFLFKISMNLRRIRGKLLSDAELKDDSLLLEAIDDSIEKMKISDLIEIVELLYRARKLSLAKFFLSEFVVPYLYRLKSEKSAESAVSVCAHFLFDLASNGRTMIMKELLLNDLIGPFLRKRVTFTDLELILQTVFNDGWTNDNEAMEIFNLLLQDRDVKEFLKTRGDLLVMKLDGKRNADMIAYFRGN